MTRRERLLTIFRGEIPNRPAIKLWGAGPGQVLMHPAYGPALEMALAKTDLLYESPRYLNWDDLYWGAAPPPITVEEARVDEEWDEVTTTVHAPAGPLRRVRRVSRLGRSGYFMEHYLKEPEDLECLFSVKYVPPRFDPAPFLALDGAIGDRGLALFLLSHAPASLIQLCNSEVFGLWIYDCPDLVHHAIGTLQQRMMSHVKDVLATGIRGVFGWGGPEQFVQPLLSPAGFDEFLVPYDQPIIEEIHNAGGYFWVHSHGKMKDVLPRFVDMGVDVLNPIEPPPMGDVTLTEAFAMAGGRMGLEGNIQVHDFFTAEPAEIRSLVREALEVGMGKRFILSSTSYYTEDPHPTERYISNWCLYMEEAFRFLEERGTM